MCKMIGIVGSRRRNSEKDYMAVRYEFLKIYEEGDIICSGGCPKGADNFAERIAKKFRVPIEIFPADWAKFGRVAGFMRNTDIAAASDVLIACVAPDRKGGTEDTIKKFIKGKRKVMLIIC